MAKHMDSITRNQIQFWIESGKSVAWIAQQLGKHPSTVWRELLNHRIKSDKRYGCSNRLCAHFDECTEVAFNGRSYRPRKNTPGCFESCPSFREAVCYRLIRAPYVCNGCEREHNCPMRKRYYIASGAQANYRGVLVNSRSGVHPDEASVRRMSDVLTPAARSLRGQT